jgi:hypothetical protein
MSATAAGFAIGAIVSVLMAGLAKLAIQPGANPRLDLNHLLHMVRDWKRSWV